MTCPVCNGTGEIDAPDSKEAELLKKEQAVILLHKAGYLHREIMSYMNYKNAASITYILKKHNEQ